ncbi:IclR family transcriptional regulator [Seohaeicola saemankumensis]|nr:IclR family transcriptional regulator [Seohaeicola saemankumensis]MCA0869214.1 IclR family transcriptional regulator [Seohaeicola saemankumensis]
MTGDPQAGGIQSLDSALRLLRVLAGQPGPVALSDLARASDMPLSKVHRYLASFAHAGLVRQAGRSGKYDLGPQAVQLGLAAMARNDFINTTADGLADLCADTGLTAMLSVWGSLGPTVVRWERSANFMVTTLGLGSVMPLLNSATGQVFLAFAPPSVTAAKLAEETAGPQDNLVARIRSDGHARVAGDLIPGLVAAAAPVLDWQGEIQAAVTLVGTDPAQIRADGDPVRRLIRFCADMSVPDRA